MSGHVISPKNCPLARCDLEPPPNTWFLWPPKSTPQTASRSVHPFMQGRRTWTVQSYCARWHQCAPHCSMHPWSHPSPQPKQQLDRFSHFAQLTAECHRACSGMSLVPFPKNCPFASVAWGNLGPHQNTGSLDPPESTVQTASRSVQPFLHSSPQECSRAYQGMSFPLKIAPSHGAMWTSFDTLFLEPTRILNPNGISIG